MLLTGSLITGSDPLGAGLTRASGSGPRRAGPGEKRRQPPSHAASSHASPFAGTRRNGGDQRGEKRDARACGCLLGLQPGGLGPYSPGVRPARCGSDPVLRTPGCARRPGSARMPTAGLAVACGATVPGGAPPPEGLRAEALTARSRALSSCEPCQIRKEAALSDLAQATRSGLARVSVRPAADRRTRLPGRSREARIDCRRGIALSHLPTADVRGRGGPGSHRAHARSAVEQGRIATHTCSRAHAGPARRRSRRSSPRRSTVSTGRPRHPTGRARSTGGSTTARRST